MKVKRICLQCGTVFSIRPSAVKNGKGKFCRRPCYESSRGTTEERFWSRVQKTDSCWIWTGGRFKDGYGGFRYKGKAHRAHRVSYEMAYGFLPPEMDLLHQCDTPLCVNPEHLKLGTQTENMADMMKKGRQAKGENSGPSKLTEEEVREIRIRYAAGGISQGTLSREYHISRGIISCLIARKIWKHVL